MDTIGKQMVGYRYGAAPECGKSWNYMENRFECGVSMAKVGHMEEVKSFAVSNLADKKVKKYYYVGIIAGEGGDSEEICLAELQQISYIEYKRLLKSESIIETSNAIVNYIANRKVSLIERGWSIGTTIEKIATWRANNTK